MVTRCELIWQAAVAETSQIICLLTAEIAISVGLHVVNVNGYHLRAVMQYNVSWLCSFFGVICPDDVISVLDSSNWV